MDMTKLKDKLRDYRQWINGNDSDLASEGLPAISAKMEYLNV